MDAGDVRVVEAGEDVALARHPLAEAARPARPRQLDGDLSLQCAVDALGQPHRAHAADAELADQAVGTDEETGRGSVAAAVGRPGVGVEGEPRQRLEEVAGFLADGLGEQPPERRLQRVGLVQGVEPGVALGHRQRQRFVEPAADGGPVVDEVFQIGHARGSASADSDCHQASR